MKVKELKKFLETLDQEGEVYLIDGWGKNPLVITDMERHVKLTKFKFYDKPERVDLGGGYWTFRHGEHVPYKTVELVIYGA